MRFQYINIIIIIYIYIYIVSPHIYELEGVNSLYSYMYTGDAESLKNREVILEKIVDNVLDKYSGN